MSKAKTLILVLANTLLMVLPSLAQTGSYKVGVKVSYVAPGETFVFSIGTGKTATVRQTGTLVYFPGTYPKGQSITITQLSGPRPANFTPFAINTVPDRNLEFFADAGAPPGMVNIRGILRGPAGSMVILQNNGIDDLPVQANGGDVRFTFSKPIQEGSAYKVTVKNAPDGQQYTVSTYAGEPGVASAQSFVRIYGDQVTDLVTRDSSNKVLGTFFESWDPCVDKSLDDNARYVTFVSEARGLAGSTGSHRQIFWRDRKTGETIMITRSPTGEEGNANSFSPVMCVGPRKVAFESYASNLVNGDANQVRDVFLWTYSPEGGSIERVSVGPGGVEGNGESFEPSISGMGHDVAFSSNANNLTYDKDPSGVNVYLRDMNSQTTTLISKDYKTGKGAGGSKPSIDWNGRRVAFYSYAWTLVPGDNNNLWDIFLYEKSVTGGAQPLRRITMAWNGGERNQGDESSSRVVTPTISGDGQYIAYSTTASNVVPNDNNGVQDVFVYNTESNTTIRASVGNDGAEGNASSPLGQGERIALSYNGNIVAFTTAASNLGVPANNIVLYNLSSQKMTAVTEVTGTYVSTPSLSRNGRYVSFGCGKPLDSRFNSSGLYVKFISTIY